MDDWKEWIKDGLGAMAIFFALYILLFFGGAL